MADNNEPVKLFYSKEKPVSLFYSKPLDIKENDSVPLFCNVNEYNNQFCNNSLTPNTVQEPQTIQNTSVQPPEVYTTYNNGYYSVAPIVQVQPNYSITNDTLSFENNIYSAVPPQVIEIFQNEARNNLTELQGILQNNKNYNEFLTRIAQLISTQAKLIVKDFQTYKLYYYDGKIFKEGEKNFIISYIRGLYDSLMDVLRNNSKFKHDSSCANNIFQNIQQIAPILKEPQNLENYIVFNNVILKLTTMELLPHSPQNFFKTLINVDYNPQAQYYHPNFDKLICTYTRGDSILNTRLLQALGLCITNDNNAKAIICFIGVGNSGKSFLIKFLSSLIDSSLITSIDPSHLGDKFALSRIYGKLICTCMDMKNAPISKGGVSVIKQISGNDMVTAEYKNSNKYIEFVSHCHMILGSNYEIISDGEDQAFENRKVVIPFQYAIDRENMETEDILLSKLENEKSAIINTLLYSTTK